MKKFLQTEIDLIYNQLQSDEEVLWRGKPRLMPNLSYISTLMGIFLIDVMLLVLRMFKISDPLYEDWYAVALLVFFVTIIVYTILYMDKNYQKLSNIFYVITNKRLLIFNGKKKRIILAKLYPAIQLLRLKKPVMDAGSIIFDIDIIDSRIFEIGFNSIEDADEVLDLINQQLHHMRTKE